MDIDGRLASGLIVLVGLAAPIYAWVASPMASMAAFRLNFLSVALPVLYLLTITGLALVAVGKRGKFLWSDETDKKIAHALGGKISNLLPNLWLSIGALWLVAYMCWMIFR
ncbi:MAG: hypothetical protein WBW92_04190 [Rhodanobacteraceae bacterium]